MTEVDDAGVECDGGDVEVVFIEDDGEVFVNPREDIRFGDLRFVKRHAVKLDLAGLHELCGYLLAAWERSVHELDVDHDLRGRW